MVKYFLNIDCTILGIKYDEIKKILVVGGYKLYSLEIRMVLEDYFGLDLESEDTVYTYSYPQRNKVRFEFLDYNENLFYKALKKIKEHDLILTPTRTLKRIMR